MPISWRGNYLACCCPRGGGRLLMTVLLQPLMRPRRWARVGLLGGLRTGRASTAGSPVRGCCGSCGEVWASPLESAVLAAAGGGRIGAVGGPWIRAALPSPRSRPGRVLRPLQHDRRRRRWPHFWLRPPDQAPALTL